MTYEALIHRSQEHLSRHPALVPTGLSIHMFAIGARWMLNRLNELNRDREIEFDGSVLFGWYGGLKYGICLSAFVGSAVVLAGWSLWLSPLSILIFYWFEIHFLFLFPLLLDRVKDPVWTSMQQTYKIGICRALITVIPIALFMLIGLFHPRAPYRNWHVGCLAIIIWYNDEVRNRVWSFV